MKHRWIVWIAGSIAALTVAVAFVTLWPAVVERGRILRLASNDAEEVRRAASELATSGSRRAIDPLFDAVARTGAGTDVGKEALETRRVLVAALWSLCQRLRGPRAGAPILDLLRDAKRPEGARSDAFQALRSQSEPVHAAILLEVQDHRTLSPPQDSGSATDAAGTDSGTGAAAETGGSPEDDGCGCGSQGDTPAIWGILGLVGLLALRRS